MDQRVNLLTKEARKERCSGQAILKEAVRQPEKPFFRVGFEAKTVSKAIFTEGQVKLKLLSVQFGEIMKKLVVLLLVAAFAAPALADVTFTATDNADGTCTIDWTSTEAVVGMGLVVDMNGSEQITAVAVDSFFDIFIDLAADDPVGYSLYDGTDEDAVADPNGAGTINLPKSVFSLCMGSVDGGGVSGSIVLTGDDTNPVGTLSEDTLRGGVVTANGAIATNLPIDFVITSTPPECVKNTAPFYSLWQSYGSPACWCYQRNCRGDIDGAMAGIIPVSAADLALFRAAFNKPDMVLPVGGECADNNRAKAGIILVNATDLATFRQYFNKPHMIVPVCDMTNYNFWTNQSGIFRLRQYCFMQLSFIFQFCFCVFSQKERIMKKLLALVLVLAVSSASFGAMVLEPVSVDKDVASTIDLVTTTDITAGNGEGYVAILVDTTVGTLDVTGASIVSLDISAFNGAVGLFGVPKPGMEGVWAGVFTFGAGYTAGTTLIDNIAFNPTGVTGQIELWALDVDTVTPLELLDTVEVVPEPMTMSLLGLGGLALIRRRR